MDRRIFLVACLAVLVVAGWLRCWRLAERSLWLDEAKTANIARGSIVQTVVKARLGNSAPVAYPLILNLVQRIDGSALAVRLPSALFSLAAVAVLFGLGAAGVDRASALVAGTVLAVSPSQVRYAQEVREYALAVLVVAVMVWVVAAALERERGRAARVGLPLVLFVAPLVQYGLALMAAAALLVWAASTPRPWRARSMIRRAATPAVALALGAGLTVVLTLRGQWRHTDAWYLAGSFYSGSMLDLPAMATFLGARLGELMSYLALGDGSVLLVVPTLGIPLLLRSGTDRVSRALLALAVLSVACLSAASVLGLYPLGPIRQDLFLAPVVAAVIGLGWGALSAPVADTARAAVAGGLLVVVVAAGLYGVALAEPYQELEDIRSVIAGLDARPEGEPVYVYYGARPALRFYRIHGPDFVYGGSHRDRPAEYAAELRRLLGPGADRLWLVFSHLYRNEAARLLDDLAPEWAFEPIVEARGASLYRGRRVAEEPP